MAWDEAMACAGPPDTTLFIIRTIIPPGNPGKGKVPREGGQVRQLIW